MTNPVYEDPQDVEPDAPNAPNAPVQPKSYEETVGEVAVENEPMGHTGPVGATGTAGPKEATATTPQTLMGKTTPDVVPATQEGIVTGSDHDRAHPEGEV